MIDTDITNPNCDPTELYNNFAQWYQNNIAHQQLTTGWCFSLSDIIKWIYTENQTFEEQQAQQILEMWKQTGIIKKVQEQSTHRYQFHHPTNTKPKPQTLLQKIINILSS
jgi:hypothetical protein